MIQFNYKLQQEQSADNSSVMIRTSIIKARSTRALELSLNHVVAILVPITYRLIRHRTSDRRHLQLFSETFHPPMRRGSIKNRVRRPKAISN